MENDKKIENLFVAISTPSQELNEQFIEKINEIIDFLNNKLIYKKNEKD